MRASFRLRIVLGFAVLALVSGCGPGSMAPARQPQEGVASTNLDDPGVRTALDAIKGDLIRQHMSTLADDKLEGRGLGSAG